VASRSIANMLVSVVSVESVTELEEAESWT
jgi:hypothetical protein